MTMGTEKLSNLPPGGLSLLDVNFAYKGLSLAENICKKWGNSCLENFMIQNQCKFVNAAGEHFRKLLDEVEKDWLNLSAGFIEGPVSNLSLENVVVTSVCERLRGGIDRYHHHENFSVCVELETFSSSEEDSSPNSLAKISHDLGHQKETPMPTSADVSTCNGCTDTGESFKNESYPEIATHVIHHDEVTGGSCASMVASILGTHSEQKPNEPNVSETSAAGLLETEAMLNVCGRVDANEAIEEFEEVRMEDFCNDDGKYELVARTSSALENMPRKKKLKFTFRWKLPSSKWCWGNDMVNNRGNASSFVSTKSLQSETTSTPSSCGPEWELL